jgi:transcriptional regulator with XRE-family HTH domain
MTRFEERVRWAVEMSKMSYSHLGKEANVHPAQIGKFMRGEISLTTESVGKILDALGCNLGPPLNRFEPKRTGRPPKQLGMHSSTPVPETQGSTSWKNKASPTSESAAILGGATRTRDEEV